MQQALLRALAGAGFYGPSPWRVAVVLWLAGSGSLLAQTRPLADTTVLRGVTLNEVRVRGTRPSLRNTSANPVQILSGKELEKLNSLSVADAVRYFSGVQLKDYGGIGGLKTINVRSMGSQHTAVFYDGIQLGNAQNGQVDLGKFSLDNIEEIELYNSQRNTILQPAKGFSSASTLYLRSKRPHFAGEEKRHGKVSLKTGSFGLVNPAVLWQEKLSARVASTVSAEWLYADGRYRFRYTNGVYDTTAVRQNADVAAWRLEAGLNGQLRDSSEWAVKVYGYGSERGLPGAIVANRFLSSQRQWDRNFFAQSSYRKEVGPRYSLLVNAKYADDYTRYYDPEYIKDDGPLENTFRQREAYFSLAHQYRLTSFWDVSLAADGLWNTLDADLYRFSYPTRYTGLVALATKLHWARLDVQGSVLGTFVDDRVRAYTSAGRKQEFTPTVSVAWQPLPTANLRVRAFYKDIFRLPTFNDLYYTFIGNTYLRPEYTKQYNLGLAYQREWSSGPLAALSFQVDGYYNQVKDKIVAVPTAKLFRWTMLNLDRVEIRGVQANLQSSWGLGTAARLTTGLNYTLERAVELTPGSDNYNQQIPYTPHHSGSVIAGVEWAPFTLNYSFLYTGPRYSQKTNEPVNYLQPWYTHDLSTSWQYRRPRHQVKLTAEVNNVLNQYYDVVLNFPMPGRSYRFTLSFTY